MGAESSEPIKQYDKYGRPFFTSGKITDPATGTIRTGEKYILSNDGDTLYVQKDISPFLDLQRTISRSSHLSGKDLSSQYLSEVLEEEIRITKIGGITDMFRIFGIKYTEAEEMNIHSLSFSNALWHGVNCGVFYSGDGKISNIFIGSDLDVVKEGEELDLVEIAFGDDGLYFEVIDNSKPVDRNIKEGGEQDFLCQLEDSKDRILLKIVYMTSAEERYEAVSFDKTIDTGKFYTIAATDGFSGWEKVLDEVDKCTIVKSV